MVKYGVLKLLCFIAIAMLNSLIKLTVLLMINGYLIMYYRIHPFYKEIYDRTTREQDIINVLNIILIRISRLLWSFTL